MVFLMHCRALFQTSQLLQFDRETRVLGLFSSSQGQVLISQGHNQDLKVFACEQNSNPQSKTICQLNIKYGHMMNILNYGAQINVLSMVRSLYVLLTTEISKNGRVWKYVMVQNRNQNSPAWQPGVILVLWSGGETRVILQLLHR